MDESYSENNNSTRQSKCLNEQIEKPSNKKTTCGVEVVSSLDNFNSNSDAKSSLPTKKQRLKEYLTTTTHDTEIDATSTNEVFEFSVDPIIHPVINLIDIAPRLLDNKKPVKVKSRWTRSSQIELAQENSVPLQNKNTLSVNNLSQSSEIINELLTMVVTPVNNINKQDIKKSIEVKTCNMDINNCQQTETCTPVQVKRKRGRPKKTINMNNKDVSPIVSNIVNENSIELNSFSHLKQEDSDSPKIVKRGRGRPKKNGITSKTTLTSQILSKTITPKKKGRKKSISTNDKKHTINVENNSCDIKSDSDASVENNSLENDKSATSEVFQKAIKEDNFDICDSNEAIVSSDNNCQAAGFIPIYRIDEFIPPFTPVRCTSDGDSTKVQTTESSRNIVINYHQDVSLELNEINWNVVPKRTRSKSVSEFTKLKQRRNSLSENFMFNSSDDTKIQNECTKLVKAWKSLSYIEGRPNIQVERYQQHELERKFRLELKRSRSFPNCMLLDTVIWRFLFFEQSLDCDENYLDSSDSDINLINELPVDEYNRQYRSKSVPLDHNESKTKKNTNVYKSLDNLCALSCTYDLPTFQVSSDVCHLKNESDPEENEGKIRRSKRLNTKVKDTDMLDEKYLLESDDSKVDYLLKAEQIRQENERQLSEAQRNDPDLDNKLKKLGFKLITDNLFKTSRRIINTDTYQCHCKYSKADLKERKPGCGSECLNRLLNIECGAGCSLKSHCTNKQFQNKQFKHTQIVKTADKGYGVFALEDIPSGTFVDEYIGEVIDQHEMIKRMKKKLYRNNNYMVQLKHDEIIDATRKGNITRFINHSCEPNCVAEKWNVLGESRMGFFSKVFIAKGVEITFDYSFEIFGDAAQQKCYCGSSKCRGYLSKKSRTGEPSSSEESDDNDEIVTTKSNECLKKKKLSIQKISNKDKKRLRELDQQLTDISKLKNKNRSDLESSTLNLNKLMVHITDSMSRSHILKFIRENDLNCKKLFMNFNGLSIIHSWMISNNDENLKLEIIKTLSELPISNRNTITKSKVIDIVAEWANIPKNIKEMIENLEYPVSKTDDHEKEVDKLLPHVDNISSLVVSSRILWKKWIILKMIFKIPKLERPKEVKITDVACKQPIVLSQSLPKPEQCNLIKSATLKINRENTKFKINHVKYVNNQVTIENAKINSLDNYSKIINHQNQLNNRDKNKTILEWNKKRENSSVKKVKVNSTFANDTKQLILNAKHSSMSAFKSKCMVKEIPTIESCMLSNKTKWSNNIEFSPTVYEVPTEYVIPVSNMTELSELYPIEEIITSGPWKPPNICELRDKSTLDSILKMPPPCTPSKDTESIYSWCLMKPENLFYDATHPSIEEQNAFIAVEEQVNKATKMKIQIQTDSNVDTKIVNENTRQKLLQQCKNNLKNLIDKGLLNPLKSSRENFIDQSPIKISDIFFQNNLSKSNIQHKNKGVSPNFFKCLKINSNFYQEQPSNIIKIHKLKLKNKIKESKSAFRIKEKESVKCDTSSVALKLGNKQLITNPKNVNINKLFKNHSIQLKTNNKFACKLFNGLLKKYLSFNNFEFTLKLPLDTKNYILDPIKEIELHQKLIPTVKNTLCAKLNREKSNDTLSVFNQKFIMKYDDSKSKINMSLISKQNQDLLKIVGKNSNEFLKPLKRKLPWPSQIDTKKQKFNISGMKNISDSKNKVLIKNQMDDSVIFKKPMIPVLDKKKHIHINNTRVSQGQKFSTSSISTLKTNGRETRQQTGPSNQLIQYASESKSVANQIRQEASSSTSGITLSKTNTNEIRQKPLMKCSPFNKVDNISAIDFEQNVKNLATNFSMDSSITISPLSESRSEQIESIVENFKTSISLKKTSANLDDPIVRDYIQRTQSKSFELNRKHKLPECMMSLPVEVLNLIPDSSRELKYVIDFYTSMASVIVKVLDLYVKKSCKQGRIKNDTDFKYLAKKLNSNILYKELQVKRVEDLKISDSVKHKVEQYIKKYMLKYGKSYRRKTSDQSSSQ